MTKRQKCCCRENNGDDSGWSENSPNSKLESRWIGLADGVAGRTKLVPIKPALVFDLGPLAPFARRYRFPLCQTLDTRGANVCLQEPYDVSHNARSISGYRCAQLFRRDSFRVNPDPYINALCTITR